MDSKDKQIEDMMKPLPFPVQMGSMNMGSRPAGALIDKLRIGSVSRYSESFVPAKHLGTSESHRYDREP